VFVNEHSLHLWKRHPCTSTVERQLTDWREQVTDLRGFLYSHSIEFQSSTNILIWFEWLFDHPVLCVSPQCVCWSWPHETYAKGRINHLCTSTPLYGRPKTGTIRMALCCRKCRRKNPKKIFTKHGYISASNIVHYNYGLPYVPVWANSPSLDTLSQRPGRFVILSRFIPFFFTLAKLLCSVFAIKCVKYRNWRKCAAGGEGMALNMERVQWSSYQASALFTADIVTVILFPSLFKMPKRNFKFLDELQRDYPCV
jgi:hypothetical protein